VLSRGGASTKGAAWAKGVALILGVSLIAAVMVIAVIAPRRAQQRRVQERTMATQLYQTRCAICHEVQGGIGSPLYARVLASYGTAQRLFNYVRLAMPYEAPRTLSNQEYWLVVGHLLRSRGLVDEEATVTDETAEGIVLDDRPADLPEFEWPMAVTQPAGRPLTDAWAPVEYLQAKLFLPQLGHQ